MHRAAITLILAMPLLAWAQGTMYRCEGPNGRPTFQQTPCEPGQKGQQMQAREVPVTTMGDNIRERVERNAQGQGETTESEMIARLGYPTVTNTDVINGVELKQHVYRYPDGSTRYVYTRNGVVYAAQNRPTVGTSRREPCHSAAAIRSADVSARSIRLSAEERQAAMDQVARMRECR